MSKRTVSLLMTVIFTVLLFAMTMNVTAAAEEERQLNTTAPGSTAVTSERVTAPSAAMTQPTTEEIVPAENDIQRGILEEVEKVLGRKGMGITTDLFSEGLSSIGCITPPPFFRAVY